MDSPAVPASRNSVLVYVVSGIVVAVLAGIVVVVISSARRPRQAPTLPRATDLEKVGSEIERVWYQHLSLKRRGAARKIVDAKKTPH